MTNSNALAAIFGTFAILVIAALIISAIGRWKVLAKAGKPGWHGIIPILGDYDLYDISWNTQYFLYMVIAMVVYSVSSGLYNNGAGSFLFSVISLAASAVVTILSVYLNFKLAKSFEKGTGFAIGLVFLNPIFMLILGFGAAKYIGKQN